MNNARMDDVAGNVCRVKGHHIAMFSSEQILTIEELFLCIQCGARLQDIRGEVDGPKLQTKAA